MSQPRARSTAVPVEVVRPMNDHGAMTVEVTHRNEARHVVEYASESTRETLSRLPSGSSIPLELEPLGPRANVWRVLRIA
ncbi:hypothetical protein ACFO0N_15360 [Halobium salinum]|uniref:DUF7999 domain-containing protein n=1 Tax=Halobium salinum TaxID=1364940 RepID=A0ABD5PEJ4_9EURY|nr:hypothetical protein [Halobium salinum]